MAMPIRPAPPTALCASIFERLMAEPDLLYIPVVMGNTPLGLVCRQKFMLTYASLYGKELYGRRPITVLMYADPMIMDGRLDCEEVNARIFTDKTTLIDDTYRDIDGGAGASIRNANSTSRSGQQQQNTIFGQHEP
jgi:hypothetical protein